MSALKQTQWIAGEVGWSGKACPDGVSGSWDRMQRSWKQPPGQLEGLVGTLRVWWA